MHDEETYHLKPAQQVKRLARESKRSASEKWQSVISPSLWFSGKPTQCMCMNTPNNLCQDYWCASSMINFSRQERHFILSS